MIQLAEKLAQWKYIVIKFTPITKYMNNEWGGKIVKRLKTKQQINI